MFKIKFFLPVHKEISLDSLQEKFLTIFNIFLLLSYLVRNQIFREIQSLQKAVQGTSFHLNFYRVSPRGKIRGIRNQIHNTNLYIHTRTLISIYLTYQLSALSHQCAEDDVRLEINFSVLMLYLWDTSCPKIQYIIPEDFCN